MTYSNSTALRGALARAIKSHVEMKGLNGVQAAKECGIANSRMSTILRGQVEKISSDALVDILGTLGYRLDSVIGATEGHEFTLTLDEGLGLPKDIEPPQSIKVLPGTLVEVDGGFSVGYEYQVGELVTKDGDRYVFNGDSGFTKVEAADESDPDADRVIADE